MRKEMRLKTTAKGRIGRRMRTRMDANEKEKGKHDEHNN